jgi:hypothetical protein
LDEAFAHNLKLKSVNFEIDHKLMQYQTLMDCMGSNLKIYKDKVSNIDREIHANKSSGEKEKARI